jgi:hypothetical protein
LISGAEQTDQGAGDGTIADAMGPTDNMPDGNNLHSQMQDTQLPFGTQILQPSRPRTSEDEPQFLGVNRLEPVMAGNTQRTEIRSGAANTDYEKRMKLLSLVKGYQMSSASTSATSSVPGFVQYAFSKPQRTAPPTTDESPTPPSDPSHRQSTQPEAEVEKGEAASSIPNHEKERIKKVRYISPEVKKAAEDTQVEEHDIQQTLIDGNSDKPPECSWMQGFVFNSETLKVPRTQADILGREASWLKPPPGVPPFQDGNMPASILKNIHLMADERAGTDIDDDSDIDPSPESLDPSPESRLQKTQDDEPVTTQEEEETVSEVSWEQTPDPPERPTGAPQGLPPDSSIEKQASHAEHESPLQLGPRGQQSSHPSVIDISDDDEPVGPPSSPPAAAASADLDEEMEMEESVPQALGEDLVQRTHSPSASDKLSDAVSLRSPVVQVKETPYAESKNAEVHKKAQNSSGESKPTSSTSIVHSTYDTPSLSDLADLGNVETAKEHLLDTHEQDISAEHKQVEVHHDKANDANTDGIGDIEMSDHVPGTEDLNKETACGIIVTQRPPNDLDSGGMPTSTSRATPNSAQLPPKNGDSEASPTVPHLASQSTKRKLVASPTKNNRRQSKRREIKIVGFGNDAPSDVDLIGTLRKDREESLRRYRAQRNSSTTSFESRPEPTSKLTVEHCSDAMNLDGVDVITKKELSPSMSPRHQGLYDEPSPRRAQPATSPASQPPKTHNPSKAHSRDTQTRGPVPIPVQSSLISSEKVDQDSDMTVFQSFKAAYPEYNGNEKHFENQCNQMYQLEQEDKMVPKWQWDDFIIRNRTDYSQYAMDCIDQGEDPEPYYRFYKDNIRDTLYTLGIIQNTKTLQRALEELGGAKTNTPRQPPQPLQKPKHARKSLPGAFGQPKKRTHERIISTSSRPRHSLPTNLRMRPESPLRPTSSASSSRPQPRHSNPITRVSSTSRIAHQIRTHLPPSDATNASADTADIFDDQGSTRDKYRDFYFGFQRTTSWTGSTNVSSTPTRGDQSPNKSFEKELS